MRIIIRKEATNTRTAALVSIYCVRTLLRVIENNKLTVIRIHCRVFIWKLRIYIFQTQYIFGENVRYKVSWFQKGNIISFFVVERFQDYLKDNFAFLNGNLYLYLQIFILRRKRKKIVWDICYFKKIFSKIKKFFSDETPLFFHGWMILIAFTLFYSSLETAKLLYPRFLPKCNFQHPVCI